MRRFVNGDEEVLHKDPIEIVQAGDRLIVRAQDGAFSAIALRHDDAILVSYKGRQYRVEQRLPRTRTASQAGSGELRAHMPGLIVAVRHAAGDAVRKGETILVLEAMKTQQPFVAPFDGQLAQVAVVTGDQVKDGALLAVVTPAEETHGG